MRLAPAVLTPTGLRFGGERLPCTIGRTGLTPEKSEGDNATPYGTLTLTGCLYRPDRMLPPAPWAQPIRPLDGWSDAPDDPDYNTPVRLPHPFRHERLWRADPLYDLILLTDWNSRPAIPGRGSAIFVHRWRRAGAPTAGCIALSPTDLRWLAARAQPGTPVMVG